MALDNAPDESIIDTRIAMDQYVSECHDTSRFGNFFRKIGVKAGELIQGFSQDFELSLYGRAQEFVALVGSEIFTRDKPLDPLQRLLRVPKQLGAVTLHKGFAVRAERGDENTDYPGYSQ